MQVWRIARARMTHRSGMNGSWKRAVAERLRKKNQKNRRCADHAASLHFTRSKRWPNYMGSVSEGARKQTRATRPRVMRIRPTDPASRIGQSMRTWARASIHRAPGARTLMLHSATAQLFRIARLALFVEKGANVLRQFSTQKLDASGFRIRAKDFIRGRNFRWFGIHDLSPLQTDYLPRSPFCTRG